MRARLLPAPLAASVLVLALLGASGCSGPLQPTELPGNDAAAGDANHGAGFVATGKNVGQPATPPENWIPAAPDVFLVEVAPGTDPQDFADRFGATLERVLDGNVVVLSGINDSNVFDNDDDVDSYEQNQLVGLAFGQELTMGFFEGHTFEPGDLGASIALTPLGLPVAHKWSRGEGVRVGIIDTGIDKDHTMFRGRIEPPQDADALGWEEYADGVDDDGDGLVDEAYGHGTFVAGVVMQVAPQAILVPARALNADGFGSLADLLTAMDALVNSNVDVLNLSLSLNQYSLLFEKRLQNLRGAGVVVVAASGNQGGATAYPASSPLAIGVAASSAPTVLASFSNSGLDCELAAPGVGMLSAYPRGQLGWGDGTSFAAPVVAGAVALLKNVEGVTVATMFDAAVRMGSVKHGELDVVACLPRGGERQGLASLRQGD